MSNQSDISELNRMNTKIYSMAQKYEGQANHNLLTAYDYIYDAMQAIKREP